MSALLYIISPVAALALVCLFLILMYVKIVNYGVPKFSTSHRHPENKRTRRKRKEVTVKKQTTNIIDPIKEETSYFSDLKSTTAESVRGFNAELNKIAKG